MTTPSPVEPRRTVLQTLNLLHSLREDLPDGQWEDGPEELLDYIKEERPEPGDPFWISAQEELDRNLKHWV